MTHIHAEGQCQKSLGSKVRVETGERTDGRTEAIALSPVLARSGIISATLLRLRTNYKKVNTKRTSRGIASRRVSGVISDKDGSMSV